MREFGPTPKEMGLRAEDIRTSAQKSGEFGDNVKSEKKIFATIERLPQRPIVLHGTSLDRVEQIIQEGVTEERSSYFIFDPRDFDQENSKDTLVALKNSLRYTARWARQRALTLNSQVFEAAGHKWENVLSDPEHAPALIVALPEDTSLKGRLFKDRHFAYGDVKTEGPINKNEIRQVIKLDEEDIPEINRYLTDAFLRVGKGRNEAAIRRWGIKNGQDPDEAVARFRGDPLSGPLLTSGSEGFNMMNSALEKALVAKAYKFFEHYNQQ